MFMLDWRRSCCKNNLLLGQENSLNNVGDTDTVIRNTEHDELGLWHDDNVGWCVSVVLVGIGSIKYVYTIRLLKHPHITLQTYQTSIMTFLHNFLLMNHQQHSNLVIRYILQVSEKGIKGMIFQLCYVCDINEANGLQWRLSRKVVTDKMFGSG